MPVTVMMMVVMVAMMPAMPPIMVMMAVVPPMHFRRRQPGIFLNGCSGAGIAERHGIRRCSKREQRADGGEAQNFRELHENLSFGVVSRLRRVARRDAARNLAPAT